MLACRRRFLVRSTLVGAAAALGSRRAVASDPQGRPNDLERPGDFSILDFDWVDSRRDRPVPVRLYLPDVAHASRPVPLVVFSHGIGGTRLGYRYLGSHWAGAGHASLHLQHVGSDRNVWTGGSPFAIVDRLHAAAQDAEAIARVGDLRFALDRVFETEVGERLDASRIAAAGHSYGANTTLLAVGARIEREGRVVDLVEPRIRAAIVISAPPFYGEASLRQILARIRVPSLHVTATEDVIRIPGYWSGADDRIAVFEAIGGPRKALAVFEGGAHSMFTDRASAGGPLRNARVKAATRELTAAFLRSTFEGDDHPMRVWPVRHGELLARFEVSDPRWSGA